jgi:hypothetical protein
VELPWELRRTPWNCAAPRYRLQAASALRIETNGERR